MAVYTIQPGQDIYGVFRQTAAGDTVVFAAGRHRSLVPKKDCLTVIRDNMRVIGEPDSVLAIDGEGTAFVATAASHLRFENLTINHTNTNRSNFSTAFDFRQCDDVLVAGCKVSGCGASAVRSGANSGFDGTRPFDGLGTGFGPTRDLFVLDSQFTDCVGPVIGFKPGGTVHAVINGCRITNYGTYAVSIEGEGQPHGVTSDILFSNNIIENGSLDFRGAAFGVLFAAYVGERAFGVKVIDNTITRLGDARVTFGAGVAVSSSPSQGDMPVSDVEIRGNTITDIVGARSAGIMLMPGNSSVTGVVISNNNIQRCRLQLLMTRPDAAKTRGIVRVQHDCMNVLNQC